MNTYRIALKTKKGLKIGLNSLDLAQAREKRDHFNSLKNNSCIIVTEGYIYGKESYREVI